MALISPILDNRSYQQLRDELVKIGHIEGA